MLIRLKNVPRYGLPSIKWLFETPCVCEAAPFWTIVRLLTAKEDLRKIGDISSVVSLWLRIGTV